MSSVLVEVPVDPRACAHNRFEELGRDGGAAFFRCPVCGSILIRQRGHRWLIRPTDEAGPLLF